jgi:hypothetical protein
MREPLCIILAFIPSLITISPIVVTLISSWDSSGCFSDDNFGLSLSLSLSLNSYLRVGVGVNPCFSIDNSIVFTVLHLVSVNLSQYARPYALQLTRNYRLNVATVIRITVFALATRRAVCV